MFIRPHNAYAISPFEVRCRAPTLEAPAAADASERYIGQLDKFTTFLDYTVYRLANPNVVYVSFQHDVYAVLMTSDGARIQTADGRIRRMWGSGAHPMLVLCKVAFVPSLLLNRFIVVRFANSHCFRAFTQIPDLCVCDLVPHHAVRFSTFASALTQLRRFFVYTPLSLVDMCTLSVQRQLGALCDCPEEMRKECMAGAVSELLLPATVRDHIRHSTFYHIHYP